MEREVLLILKRDNLYSTEFMKFAIFKIRITDILSKIIGRIVLTQRERAFIPNYYLSVL
jgi:hypothetical protein